MTSDEPAARDEPRPVWNAMHVDRPAVTVRCTGTADVVDAVNFARERDLLVAVRGGGHSVAGLSTVATACSSTCPAMRGVQVDPDRRLARVQGGALLGDVDRETQAFGLATPLGRVSETGVAGLTLGGGYGHLNAKYGLSCDNLVEAQVVCADGTIRTASADSEPGSVLGDPRWRRELRRRHVVHLPPAPGRADRRLRRSLLPAVRARRHRAAVARLRAGRAGRGHLVRRRDDLPGRARNARGHPRPAGRHRRRRALRATTRTRGCARCSRCASWAHRCSTCPSRCPTPRCRPRSTRSSPAGAARLLEVPVPRRAQRRRHRRPRGQGAGTSRAADAWSTHSTSVERCMPSDRRTRPSPNAPRRSWCRWTPCGPTRRRTTPPSRGAARRGRRWPSTATATSSSTSPDTPTSRCRPASTPRTAATCADSARSRPPTTRTTSSGSTTTSLPCRNGC